MKYTREQRAHHKAIRDIYYRHHNTNPNGGRAEHPNNGLSVREVVAEAREGWPKVPVPKDPYAAAQRVLRDWTADTGQAAECRVRLHGNPQLTFEEES